jgi:hypothetical protein
MEVEVTLEFSIPDDSLSDVIITQAIFDSYINFATIQHLSLLRKWIISKEKYESAGDMHMTTSATQLIRNHQPWSAICENVEILNIKKI